MSNAGGLLCICCSHPARRHFRHPAKRNSLCCRDCPDKICTLGEGDFDFDNGQTIVMTDQGAAQKFGFDAWVLLPDDSEKDA